MICFSLVCGNDHGFEGWFRDGVTFDRQASEGAIACPECGDHAVRKAMMAPAVVRSGSRAREVAEPAARLAAMPDEAKAAIMIAMVRKMREHVETHFENVGERFPDEARRIHYGDAAEREIYGKASLEEARELVEEGIGVHLLPDVPDLDS